MMTCLEFRRRVGAEPAAADEDVAGAPSRLPRLRPLPG